MRGKWTLQYGFANRPRQSFKFEEEYRRAFSWFLAVAVHRVQRHAVKGMMTVIYEFQWMTEATLHQNYDIYFTNEEAD